jgi:hypothetical protein
MSYQSGVKGKLLISGSFQFKDKDGKVVGEMKIKDGAIPLNRFSPEEQQQLIKDYGHGTDNR